MTKTARPDASRAEEIPLPALLRAARGAYANAVRAGLVAAGFEDVPRSGAFVLGGMANHGVSAGDLIRQLGVTKQAASQLIDAMVVRGYLVREVDPDDRRRMTIEPTERGRAAASVVRDEVEAVNTKLAEMLSVSELAGLRTGLVALYTIRERMEQGWRPDA